MPQAGHQDGIARDDISIYIWWDKAHGGELYKQKGHGFLSPNQVFSKSTGLDARVFV